MRTGRYIFSNKMHILLAAVICPMLLICAPAAKSLIVSDEFVKCVYDPARGNPKPLGRREFITIDQIDGDTHFRFQRLPDMMLSGNDTDTVVSGATIEVHRKIIFYNTRIQQARKIMRSNNDYYYQLIGYRDPIGFSTYDDTLGCDSESNSTQIESRLLTNSIGKELVSDGLVSADAVLDVAAYGPDGGARVTAGDQLTLRVRTAVDAYVSCYYQQGGGDIYKLYPNQYSGDYQIARGTTLYVPGVDRYQLVADRPDQTNQFMCLINDEDILPLLPPVYRANRFQRIPVASFDELFQLYRGATDQNLVARVVAIEVQ